MLKTASILKSSIVGLTTLLAVPLLAQVPPIVDGPVFGGTTMFSRDFVPVGKIRMDGMDSYFALGYAQGDMGADKFYSHLDDFSSGTLLKMADSMRGFNEAPWGCRSRAYGLEFFHKGSVLAYSRQEMTSIWVLLDNEPAGESADFDVRRSVVDRLTYGYSGSKGSFYCSGKIRVERWALGGNFYSLGFHSSDEDIGHAKSLMDYDETQNTNITYALDVFIGYELARGFRIGVQADRLSSKTFGDVEEKPQFKAGTQIDIGTSTQLTIETDINETARLPFPVMQKTVAASLKLKANNAITLSVGATQKTLDGHKSNRYGLTAWLTGKKHHVGAGFHFGGDRVPWGANWKMP